MRSFGLGLLEGLATSSSKGINDAMDDLDGKISRLSEKRMNKVTTEQARWNKDFANNEEQIKYLANQLNINGGKDGMRLLHSLINTESFEGAKAIIPSIVQKLSLNGLDATNYLTNGKGLTALDAKKLPNAKSLTNLITLPMNVPDMDVGTALEGSGANILNIFTRANDNVAKYAQRTIKSDMALAGLSEGAPTFAELPASENLAIDKFDLQLGKSYENDLKIITARIDSLTKSDALANKDQINKLKTVQDTTRSMIIGTSDKALTPSAQKSASSQFSNQRGLSLGIKQSMINGDWNTLEAKSAGSKDAADTGTINADHLKWAKSFGRASLNDKKNPNATARGIIPETFHDKIRNGESYDLNSNMNPFQFLMIASANGLNVKRITKEMISKDDTLDLNNGNPYLTISHLRKDPPSNPSIKFNNTITDEKNITDVSGADADTQLNSIVVAFRNNRSSTQARKFVSWANTFQPNTTILQRKQMFENKFGYTWDSVQGAGNIK